MAEKAGTQALRNMVKEAIAERWPESGGQSSHREAQVRIDRTADAIMRLIESVHENALGYGQLVGEERVLDALIEGNLGKAAQRHWWESTKAKIEAGKV